MTGTNGAFACTCTQHEALPLDGTDATPQPSEDKLHTKQQSNPEKQAEVAHAHICKTGTTLAVTSQIRSTEFCLD